MSEMWKSNMRNVAGKQQLEEQIRIIGTEVQKELHP